MITIPFEDEIQVLAIVESGDEAITADHQIRFALVSNYMWWDGAYNGQEDFYHSCIDMAPDADGLEFTIEANSVEVYETYFNWPIELLEEILEEDNVSALVWIQNDDTKEVIQSEMNELGGGYDFYTISETTDHLVAPGDVVEFELEIANIGLLEDSYDITIASNVPEEWDFSYTTPDGETSENSTITLIPDETFTSTITIETSGVTMGVDGIISFTVTSQAVPPFTYTYDYYTHAAGEILIINGDPAGNYSDYYMDAIAEVQGLTVDSDFRYSTWNKSEHLLNPVEIVESSPLMVIWYTGDGGTLHPLEMVELENYLNAGGTLWISGSNAPFYLDGSSLITMMGAAYQSPFEQGYAVHSAEEDPYFVDLEFDIMGGDGADNRGTPSSLNTAGGTECLMYSTIRNAGIRYQGDGYRTLLFGFPFEAIADSESRTSVMLYSWIWLIDYLYNPVDERVEGSVPSSFALNQNYPNPFNPETDITFTLPENSRVKLSIFDMMGREVTVLANGQYSIGTHSVSWNAAGLPSGIYFYSLSTSENYSNFSSTRKMMLLK